ncbi:MAG: hypothetical protein ACLTEE_06210 [Anaerobutyricum hallii]
MKKKCSSGSTRSNWHLQQVILYPVNHDSVQMDLIKDTFTIGKVTDRDGSYVCPITIATNAYAEKYSTQLIKNIQQLKKTSHTLQT